MNKKVITILIVLFLSSVIQHTLGIEIEGSMISSSLVVFSIFFGFYITSFAVFATSKYLPRLYEIEDKSDNSLTLLDVLLEDFKHYSHILLYSIIYLLLMEILVNNFNEVYLVKFLLYFYGGVIFLNFFNAFQAVALFVKVVRQSLINS